MGSEIDFIFMLTANISQILVEIMEKNTMKWHLSIPLHAVVCLYWRFVVVGGEKTILSDPTSHAHMFKTRALISYLKGSVATWAHYRRDNVNYLILLTIKITILI